MTDEPRWMLLREGWAGPLLNEYKHLYRPHDIRWSLCGIYVGTGTWQMGGNPSDYEAHAPCVECVRLHGVA
jgi:hypothetical protein